MKHKDKILFEIYSTIRKQEDLAFLNEDKLLLVIQYWFNHFIFMIHNINKNNLSVSEDDVAALQRSILYAPYIGVDYSEKSFFKKPKKIISYLSFIINFLFISKFYNAKVGILPGGLSGSFADRQKYRLFLLKMQYAKVSINYEFKAQFIKQASLVLENDQTNLLLKLIPELFFATGLKEKYRLPLEYKGALNCFLDNNYNYFKILLYEKKVHLTGIQHGGCYGEWMINPFEKFELEISDIFYGWGLSTNNISQNRFPVLLNNEAIKKDRIYWIGRDKCRFEGINSLSFEGYEDHINEVSHIRFYRKLFDNYEIAFLKHPRNSHSIYKDIFPSKNNQNTNSETLISNAKLVIFDSMCHTLMYYCIFFEIPFVILLNKFPVNGLSEKALEFYSVLSRNNILISVQDSMPPDSKMSFLKSYLNKNEDEFFNDEVKAYFKLHFRKELTVSYI